MLREGRGRRLAAHGFDAEGDMFFERDADFFGAFDDVFTADAARERFVLLCSLHGAGFQVQNTFRCRHKSKR